MAKSLLQLLLVNARVISCQEQVGRGVASVLCICCRAMHMLPCYAYAAVLWEPQRMGAWWKLLWQFGAIQRMRLACGLQTGCACARHDRPSLIYG